MSDQTNPKKKRLSDPKVALREFENVVSKDPRASSREALLNAFYRFPYAVTEEERRGRILVDGARSNHGILALEVERKMASLLDMVYERPIAARISYTGPDLPDKKATKRSRVSQQRSRYEISQTLSEAFQKFVIKPWEDYAEQKELEILDMLLFANGVSVFDEDEVYPRQVPMEMVKPNVSAGFNVKKWQYWYLMDSMPASILWEKANRDNRWDKKQIISILRRQKDFAPLLKRFPVSEGWVKMDKSGEWQSQLETVEVQLLACYVQEWNGSITKRYLDPDGVGKSWMWEKEGFADDFSQVISLHLDFLGHGKYYAVPSYAEKLFLQCKDYDLLMNQAKDGARMNAMAIFERNGTQSRAARVLRDHMILEPGTSLTQQRIEIPITDLVRMGDKLLHDVRQGIGSYQPQESGEQTAYEKRADLMTQERVHGVTSKRWNACQTAELREIYRRLFAVAKAGGIRPGDVARKQFEEFCKSKGLTEEHWRPENVVVESVIQVAAGEPALRLDRARETLSILRIRPNSPGEQAAQRDAICALNGMMNADDYMPQPRSFPDEHSRQIGGENESLKDQNAKTANVPVLYNDPHILHVLGDVRDGGVTIGHLPEFLEEVQLGLRMMEQAQGAPESELPLLADKINSQIVYASNFLEHIMQHMEFIAGDRTLAPDLNEIQINLAQGVRLRDELVANFGGMQEARMQALQNQSSDQGGMTKANEAKVLSDIRIAGKIEETQAKIDAKRMEAEAKAEAIRSEAAAKLAAKMVQDSAKTDETLPQ